MHEDVTEDDSLYAAQAMDDHKRQTPWQIKAIAYFMFCLLLLMSWISWLHYAHRGEFTARQKLHMACSDTSETLEEFEACICTQDDCKEHNDGHR